MHDADGLTEVALPLDGSLAVVMRQKVDALQAALSQLDQYQPTTEHFFHGGMYCRKVYRDAGVLVVGRVHKREHLYVIVSGRVLITDGENEPIEKSSGDVLLSMPGTKRAVLSLEPTVCMTFHRTDATTVEDAESELVETDPKAMYDAFNDVRAPMIEVKQ